MRTEAQITASRANGAKSRGPITTIGRAISAQNSATHGLAGQTRRHRRRIRGPLASSSRSVPPRIPARN